MWLCALVPVSATAQTAPPNPPGPYVLDVRAALSGVPQDSTFFPPVSTGTVAPKRGLGVEIGGHVYVLSLGPARLGLGASLMRVGGASTPVVGEDEEDEDEEADEGSSAPTTVDAGVHTALTIIAPQLSLNFGSGDGWSYVSAGVGRATVRTRGPELFLDGERSSEKETVPRSLNFGGGARWFMKRHLAFSFDLRFHIISAGEGDIPTPGATLVAASAGISLK